MALQHLALNWDLVTLCGSTALVAVTDWVFFPKNRFEGLKPVEPVHAFPDSDYSASLPVISSSRPFYTVELRPDVTYHDGVGDMGLAAFQTSSEGTKYRDLPTKTNSTCILGNDTSVPNQRRHLDRAQSILFTLFTFITFIIDELKRLWHAVSLIPLDLALLLQGSLFAIILQFFFAWLKQYGIATYQSLHALLCRYFRNALLSLLSDDFISSEDWTRAQNDQTVLNLALSSTMKSDQEKMLGLISTLSSLAVELRSIQNDGMKDCTKTLSEIQNRLSLQQKSLLESQAALQTSHKSVCTTIRRYSTYNANFKSAFEEQCSRLKADDVLGHVAALLAYVQSEFAHIAAAAGPRPGGGFGRR